MRWQAITVLLAIALGIAVPPSLSLTTAQGGQTEIGILDVCHAATPALSSNGEMPCLSECSSSPLPLAQNKVVVVANHPFHAYLMSFQDERPPKR